MVMSNMDSWISIDFIQTTAGTKLIWAARNKKRILNDDLDLWPDGHVLLTDLFVIYSGYLDYKIREG